jgi:glycosyltransferase involved in cell wall biosynthesis
MQGQNNRNMSFVCFGGEDWWYHNQAHIDMQLMRRFARKGPALYVNSIVMRKPNIAEGKDFTRRVIRKSRSILKGLKESGAGFWVYSPFTLPVQHIAWAKPFNEAVLRRQIQHVMRKLGMGTPILWVACPSACDAAFRMKRAKLVYQRTDRYEDDPQVDREAVLEFDRKLKTSADLTVYVSRSLYDEEAGQCKRAFFLDHGVDYEMFAAPRPNGETPADIADVPRPIVGYFGALDQHKLDADFIGAVADLLPEMSFVLIGGASVDCSGLLARKNVHILGQKPYEQIPRYGACFDVSILPWRINKWTEAANPIKLKEYLALGKPVVSTPAFTELESYRDVVYEATTSQEFARCIRTACREDGPALVNKRRQRVAQSSWDSKAQSVLQELFKEE